MEQWEEEEDAVIKFFSIKNAQKLRFRRKWTSRSQKQSLEGQEKLKTEREEK